MGNYKEVFNEYLTEIGLIVLSLSTLATYISPIPEDIKGISIGVLGGSALYLTYHSIIDRN